jgi:hypothetical protein
MQARRIHRFPLLVAAVLSGLACAGHQANYNPFVVPRDRVIGSVHTVALVPMVAPEDLEGADPRRGDFEALLTRELRTAGYSVIPSEEAGAIWRRVTDSIGGLFDPASGQRDSTRFARARELTMRELHDRFQADAWLHPQIVVAPAKFNSGTAEWDGTTQSYQSFGKKFLAALFGVETSGRAPALSVMVILEDLDGRSLYVNQGGLQLFEVPSGHDFVRVPVRELFADSTRNATAVHLALGPWIAPKPAREKQRQ